MRIATLLGTALTLASCATGPVGVDMDRIDRADVYLPDGARAGMFITWRTEIADPGDLDTVEETTACVAETPTTVTIEHRETRRDGVEIVTAARFDKDGGALHGVWRGEPGGVGVPLRVVEGYVDQDEEQVLRRAQDLAGADDPEVEQAGLRKVIDTPAGRLDCVGHRTTVKILLVSAELTVWFAVDPLPLAQLVRVDLTDSLDAISESTVLVAYGFDGAKPTLRIPR
jgi:hypothetical protein